MLGSLSLSLSLSLSRSHLLLSSLFLSPQHHHVQPVLTTLPDAYSTRSKEDPGPFANSPSPTSIYRLRRRPNTHHRKPTFIHTPLSAATMCLITTPRKDRYELRREDRYDAPRPVSNFHGGPHYQHDHARSSRTYSRPPADFRRSVSRSSRVYDIEPRRSGREVDYVRTSRTYVR